MRTSLRSAAAALRVAASVLRASRGSIYYHGGAKVYDRLLPGGGIDGNGIYLTTDRDRALMYAKRDAHGVDRDPAITEVEVDLTGVKIWDYSKEFDLREFTDAPWLADMIEKYGEKSATMNGENARIYLFGNDNAGLRKLGYRALKKGTKKNSHDLIVLDPSIIKYVGPERDDD